MMDISDWRNLCVASIVSQIGEDLPDAVWHRAQAQAVEAVDFAASRGADITQCGRDSLHVVETDAPGTYVVMWTKYPTLDFTIRLSEEAT